MSDAIDLGGGFFELKRLFDEEVRRVEALMIEKSPAAFSPKLDAAAVALAFLFNGERIGYAKDVFSHATKFIDLSHSVHADVFNLWLKAE